MDEFTLIVYDHQKNELYGQIYYSLDEIVPVIKKMEKQECYMNRFSYKIYAFRKKNNLIAYKNQHGQSVIIDTELDKKLQSGNPKTNQINCSLDDFMNSSIIGAAHEILYESV